MKALVCGGRNFTERHFLRDVLDALETRPTLIIEGGQRTRDRAGVIIGGADYWAMRWARLREVPCETYEARWDDLETAPVVRRRRRDGSFYNAAAGGIRNQRMLDEGRPDMVIAFPGGSGTADMVRRARAASVPVILPMASQPQCA